MKKYSVERKMPPHSSPSALFASRTQNSRATVSTFTWMILATTFFHFWWAGIMPPTEDELYYWTWSKNLSASYFDHPPMVAYWIRCFTFLFGDNIFAIRMPAVLSSAATLLITSRLYDRPWVLSWVLLTPLFLHGSILMTPDVPLLFFWSLYVFWMASVSQTLSGWDRDPISRVYRAQPVVIQSWILGGIILGLGGLSKYTMILAVPCGAIALFFTTQVRGWILGYMLHGIVAGLITLPVFLFNVKHHFAPLLFQWEHSMGDPSFSLMRVFSYLGEQSLLVGGIVFLILPWMISWRREIFSIPRLRLCAFFFLTPLVFFLYKTIQQPLEANWGLITYLSVWPIIDHILQRTSFREMARILTVFSFLPALALSVLFIVHVFYPVKWLPVDKDRYRLLASKYSLSHQVANEIPQALKTIPIYSLSYQWVSYFRFQGLQAEQAPDAGRLNHFSLNLKNPCEKESVLTWEPWDIKPTGFQCFGHREVMKEYEVSYPGHVAEKYFLVQYSKR